MSLIKIAKAKRLRSTPYTSRIEKQGVTAYTTYNHMLLPAAFEDSLEDSYYHLKEHVQIWDVCLLYTSPSPRDRSLSRMPSSA